VAAQVSREISQPGSYPLKVTVPDCFAQVDLYVTARKAGPFDNPNNPLGDLLASTVWPNAGPQSMWNGGTACVRPTPSPTVAPTSTTQAPPVAAAASGNNLPETGASPLPKIGIAVLLLAAGTGLVLLGRRRRTTH
jgi:LPXTG-motif cell wall-anchored protein